MINVETIQVYKIGDKVFESLEEATAYANRTIYTPIVEQFIESRTWKRGQDTIARRVASDLLAWLDTRRALGKISFEENYEEYGEPAEAADKEVEAPFM